MVKPREHSPSGAEPTSTADLAEERPRYRRLSWSLFAFAAAWVVVGSAMLLLRLADGALPARVVIGPFTLLPPAAAFSIAGLVVALRQPPERVRVADAHDRSVLEPRGEPAARRRLRGQLGDGLDVGAAVRADGDAPAPPAAGWAPAVSEVAVGLASRHRGHRSHERRIPVRPESPGNPIANERLVVIALAGLIVLGICALLSIASLVVRSRSAGADERHQIRWIAIGTSVFLATWILSIFAGFVFTTPTADVVLSGLALLFYAAIPVSIGIAILKYRLHDIDVVIRKTLVVAVLAAIFVLVYALVVGGVGALVESSSNSVLSFAAAAIVAVLFQPMLARARRFADRVVYGKRATPYEVLAEFSEHLAETYGADDVLPRTARVLAQGVGADRARVWLSVGNELQPVATWPLDADPARADDHRAECATKGTSWGPCRSRCRRTIPWTPPRRS